MCDAPRHETSEGEVSEGASVKEDFNDDMIKRFDIPPDAMALIHDLAYAYLGKWSDRAQVILKRKKSPRVKGYTTGAQ